MKHITQTPRWAELEDQLAEQEYRELFCDNGIRLTPKQRKINYLSAKYGWEKKELKKLKSKQLGAIKLSTD